MNELGNTYGGMKIIEILPSINPDGKKNIKMVKVKCEHCNNILEKRLYNIKRESTVGCSRDCSGFKNRISTHGLSNSRVYKSWDNMVTRCTRTSHKSYEHYDNLIVGEKIDPRWMKFENFLEDMGNPENKKLKFSIDRKNNRLGYSKENCRWATQTEQMLNQEKSIVNKFTSEELECIKKFHELASRFRNNKKNNFTTKSIESIFSMTSATVTKILNNHYIEIAKEKEIEINEA